VLNTSNRQPRFATRLHLATMPQPCRTLAMLDGLHGDARAAGDDTRNSGPLKFPTFKCQDSSHALLLTTWNILTLIVWFTSYRRSDSWPRTGDGRIKKKKEATAARLLLQNFF